MKTTNLDPYAGLKAGHIVGCCLTCSEPIRLVYDAWHKLTPNTHAHFEALTDSHKEEK